MRQLSFDETAQVGGAVLDCGDLSLSISLPGVSISGSLTAWNNCLTSVGDTLSGHMAHWSTGIPYGAAHIA